MELTLLLPEVLEDEIREKTHKRHSIGRVVGGINNKDNV